MVSTFSLLLTALALLAQEPSGEVFSSRNTAVEKTPGGALHITPIYHATVLFQFNGVTVCTDPYEIRTEMNLPVADVILLTHTHADHFDESSIKRLAQASTVFVVPKGRKSLIGSKIPHAEVIPLENGRSAEVRGIGVQAVPAYNLMGRDPSGVPFHARGGDNGYVLDFQGFRVYIAGDTERTREMENLGKIDVAFLPILRPYCMDDVAVVDALKIIKPRVFYPYHYMNPFTGARADIAGVVRRATELGIETRVARIY